jgi:hypothetical protein
MGHLVNGELEDALILFEKGNEFLPNRIPMLPFLAVTYEQLGRDKDARTTMDIFKKAGFKLKQVMYGPGKFEDPGFQERYAASLTKAGLPGKVYYQVRKENKLSEKEIGELFFGHEVTGFDFWTDKPWWLSCEKEKGLYRNAAMSANVDIWIEDDMICRQGKDLYDGLKDCAYVYTNPHGKPENKDEYFLMTDYGIYPFSIVAENDK